MLKYAKSTGEKNAAGAIQGPCALTGLHVITDGTNAGKAVLVDALTGTGTVKVEHSCVGANLSSYISFSFPVVFDTGIHVAITGTNATFIVEYIDLSSDNSAAYVADA